ncbi:hypothetical protein DVDV_1856 [Desulfovibrio sp. DV]|nr:hypothetical protein DVDV_1856 [Desulfovibrio sp. DV]
MDQSRIFFMDLSGAWGAFGGSKKRQRPAMLCNDMNEPAPSGKGTGVSGLFFRETLVHKPA